MARIDNLTGVRAVAALWVVLFHLNVAMTPVHGRLGSVVAHGLFGVDLFFVLSGFVLSMVYARRLPERFQWSAYRDFLVRRFAKIYPLHLLTLLTMIGLVFVAARLHIAATSGAENTVWTAICSALMLHSLGLSDLGWNVPSWSVSAEWFAYSVLFVPMVLLLRGVRAVYVAGLPIALLVALGLATPLLGDPWTTLDSRGALRILPEFLCGYLLYRFVQEKPVRHGDAVAALGVALLLLACYLPGGNLWLLVPSVMVLLAGLHAGGPLTDRLFGNRVLVALGDASYSTYLLQTFVLIAAKQVCQRLHVPDTTAMHVTIPVAVLIAAAGVGLLCFRYVEEPLRLAVLRRLGGNRKNPERTPLASGDETQVAATIG